MVFLTKHFKIQQAFYCPTCSEKQCPYVNRTFRTRSSKHLQSLICHCAILVEYLTFPVNVSLCQYDSEILSRYLTEGKQGIKQDIVKVMKLEENPDLLVNAS